jgi:D-alanyl-D-alanine carboxypeptidase (penicillin-binding protein 5/6)
MKTQTKISMGIIGLSGIILIGLGIYSKQVSTPPEAMTSQGSPQVLGLQTSELRGIPLQTSLQKPPEFVNTLELNTEKIFAKSFYVYDRTTGQVLVEKNSQLQTSIASLTKLLTIYLAYQYLPNNEPLIVNSDDQLTTTPLLHLQVGDQILPKQLIEAVLIGSANDAAMLLGHALEEKTGQSITQLMNDAAKKLGLSHSQFSNPLGFDSIANFSTASDVHLLIEAVRYYHNYYETGRLTNQTFESMGGITYRVRATNKLVAKYPDIVAIKTGYTEGAQGAMATQFKLEDRDIVIIVLGSDSRENDTLILKSEVSKKFRLPQ